LKTRMRDEEQIAEFLSILKEVWKFDPTVNTYKQVKERLPEGSSTYQKHNKTYYEKHKEELNKKRANARITST